MNPASGSTDNAAVALRGASLAFNKRPAASLPIAIPSGRIHDNEAALTAAASAGGARAPAGLVRHDTGSSGPETELYSYQAGLLVSKGHQLGVSPGTMTYLQPGGAASAAQHHHPNQNYNHNQIKVDHKSPSFIAATLAASRSASPSPSTRTPRRIGSLGAMNALSPSDAVDSAPIPPTGSLISMFEQARGDGGHPKRSSRRSSPSESARSNETERRPQSLDRMPPKPIVKIRKPKLIPPPSTSQPQARAESLPPRRAPSPPPVAAKPTPIAYPPKPRRRSISPVFHPPKFQAPASKLIYGLPPIPTSMLEGPLPKPSKPNPHQPNRESQSLGASPRPRGPTPPPPIVSRTAAEVLSPKPRRPVKSSLPSATVPNIPPALSARQPSLSPEPDPQKRTPKRGARPPTPPQPRGSQRLQPPRPPTQSGRERGHSETTLPSSMASIYASSPSASKPHANVQRLDGRSPPSHTWSDRRQSIASAPASPTREAPRRRLTNASTSNLQLDSLSSAIVAGSLAASRLTPHNTSTSIPPPPLPQRQKSPRLLQTLRQTPVETEDEQDNPRRGHRHKLNSSKHAHHEGSRKRWRDEMTLRERKRYEAVWASNRGRLLTEDSPSGSVASGIGRENSECVVNVVVRELWKRSRLPEDELIEVWDLVDRDNRGILTRQEFVVGMWLLDQRLRGRKIPIRVSDSVWSSANGVRVKGPKVKR